MHDFPLVHVLEGTGNLAHILPDGIFLEWNIIGNMLLDELLEITFFCPLGYNIELIVLDEGVDVFDDVWVVEGLHEVDFL